MFGEKGTGEAITLKVPLEVVSVFLSQAFCTEPSIDPPFKSR